MFRMGYATEVARNNGVGSGMRSLVRIMQCPFLSPALVDCDQYQAQG